MARPRKPTHLKVVAGTARPSRINANEPKPKKARPEAPAHLSERARAAWDRVAGFLDEMGVLARVDEFAVEGLCEAYAELCAARQSLKEHGAVTYEAATKDGGRIFKPYPEIAMINDADRRFCMWLAKVGLTPADRSRVSVVDPPDDNPFSYF